MAICKFGIVAYFILLAALLGFPAFSAPTKGDKVFDLVLSGPTTIIVGARPSFEATVTNTSASSAYFVTPLDDSGSGRYPQMNLEIRGPNNNICPINRAGRCGNIDGVPISAVTSLKSGESIKFMVNTLEQAVWQCNSPFSKPGRYEIVLKYDLKVSNLADWCPTGMESREPDAKLVARLRQVPAQTLVSPPFSLSVNSISPAAYAQCLLAYYCNNDDAISLLKDYQAGKWQIQDIRSVSGYTSCLVTMKPGYRALRKPLNGSTRPAEEAFPASRFLFAPRTPEVLRVIGYSSADVRGDLDTVSAENRTKLGF